MDPLSDFNWIHSKEKKKRAVLLGFTWGGDYSGEKDRFNFY